MSRRARQVLVWGLAAAALLATSIAYTWPVAAGLSTTVPGDQRDPLLNAAVLDHVFRSIATLRWSAVSMSWRKSRSPLPTTGTGTEAAMSAMAFQSAVRV